MTTTTTGCACWFDPLEEFLDAKACACCTDEGTQCGYPQHNWCQPKVSDGEIQQGCVGK